MSDMRPAKAMITSCCCKEDSVSCTKVWGSSMNGLQISFAWGSSMSGVQISFASLSCCTDSAAVNAIVSCCAGNSNQFAALCGKPVGL